LGSAVLSDPVLVIALRSIARGLEGRPGLVSGAIHAGGLGVRLAFMFALLYLSGPALLGQYGLLASIEVVAIYLAGLEFHAFTTRRYARRPGALRLRIALASHARLLCFSVPAAMLGAGVATWLFGLGLTPLALFGFLVIVATGSVAQEMLRFIVMTQRPVAAAILGFIRTALWQPVALLFVATEQPLEALALTWMAAAVVSLLWGGWMLRGAIFSRIRPGSRYLGRGLKAARNYYAMASASVLQSNLERFVLQLFLGPEAVGIFTFFQNLANALPALIQSSVLNVWLAQLLNQFGQGLQGRFALVAQVQRKVLVTCAILSMGVVVGVTGIALVLSRDTYLYNLWILPALLLAQSLIMWSQPLYLGLFGAHRDRIIMIQSLSVLAATLALCVLCVAQLGITGAVVSQLAGGAGLALLRWVVFVRYRRAGWV